MSAAVCFFMGKKNKIGIYGQILVFFRKSGFRIAIHARKYLLKFALTWTFIYFTSWTMTVVEINYLIYKCSSASLGKIRHVSTNCILFPKCELGMVTFDIYSKGAYRYLWEFTFFRQEADKMIYLINILVWKILHFWHWHSSRDLTERFLNYHKIVWV